MKVETLELKNYRNYEEVKIEFDPETNILYGDNAQGKTNLLEAVYLCSAAKSHRGTKDRDIIRFQEEEAHIKLVVRKHEVPYRIDMHLKKTKTKGIAINGIPIRKVSELFGIINVIFFSPEDLSIIKNGPAERRKFVDMELCQLDKVYLHDLTAYNKIIKQRGKLLKELGAHFDRNLYATLDVWDMQLAEYGNKVVKRREQFIKEINEIIFDIHKKLTGGKEALQLRFEPDVAAETLQKELRLSRDKDLKYKTTTRGPHRDDMGFYLKEIDLRKFGSQGQQRTAALSLKLSEIALVKKLTRDEPVLLLDDVMSELDSNRQNYLIDSIHDTQTILTCTGLDELIEKRLHVNKIYKIVNGTADLYEMGKEQQ